MASFALPSLLLLLLLTASSAATTADDLRHLPPASCNLMVGHDLICHNVTR
eukprot:COSAG06_NODE_44334_length_364_cov_0.969811_1_plen_50_part_10